MTDRIVELLERVVVAIEGLRSDLRRHYRNDSATRWELRARLMDAFGRHPFTTMGIAGESSDNPELRAVLERCGICFEADERSRSTQIGMLIAGLQWVERIGIQGGAALFRLVDL